MKLTVTANYTINASATVTLPEGKTWDDVFDYSLKWDTLYIRFKGDSDHTPIQLDYPMDFPLTRWTPNIRTVWKSTRPIRKAMNLLRNN